MGNKVVVTGGAGFIGSHLCEHLLNQGDEVICIDNFYTGQRENIMHLQDGQKFTVFDYDISRAPEVLFLMLEEDIKKVYNLACPASPVHYQHDPIQTVKTCVHGTLNMLELAREAKAKFLHTSTSEVYGDPIAHPQKEDYWGNVNPIGPRACYDEGKRCAETLCIDYHKSHNVEVKIVRIFNTYGPRMRVDDGRVVSNFIISALQNKNITIYGNGLQTRSFCYIDDMIKGILSMMEYPAGFPGPVNLGNPTELTVLQLAEKITDLCGSSSRFVFLPKPQDDPVKRCPDISLAKEKLNWQPVVSLEHGLKETILYFEDLLRQGKAGSAR